MFNQCRPAEAVERYVGDVYVQHNPEVGDGKQDFVEYFERMARDRRGRPRRAPLPPGVAGGPDYAGIDIFRFDETGRVVEPWDVLQDVPETSANDNSMF